MAFVSAAPLEAAADDVEQIPGAQLSQLKLMRLAVEEAKGANAGDFWAAKPVLTAAVGHTVPASLAEVVEQVAWLTAEAVAVGASVAAVGRNFAGFAWQLRRRLC